MITLKMLKEWVNSLPEEFDDYAVVNGEEGQMNEEYWYRVDRPIVSLGVDTDSKEILILTVPERELTEEDIKRIE